MKLMFLKKFGFFFLLLSAILLSTSSAGRPSGFLNKSAKDPSAVHEEDMMEQQVHEDETVIHERFLGVNTNDYGRYDPSPTFVKPPFKLIPN